MGSSLLSGPCYCTDIDIIVVSNAASMQSMCRDLLRRARHKLAGVQPAEWGEPLRDSTFHYLKSQSLCQIAHQTGLSQGVAAQMKYSNMSTHTAMQNVAHPPDTSGPKCLEALQQVRWFADKIAIYRRLVTYMSPRPCYISCARTDGFLTCRKSHWGVKRYDHNSCFLLQTRQVSELRHSACQKPIRSSTRNVARARIDICH